MKAGMVPRRSSGRLGRTMIIYKSFYHVIQHNVICVMDIDCVRGRVVTPTENAVAGLPPSNTVRWSPQRKASVVEAVRDGLISLDEACRRYQLSAEEFQEWQQALTVHGLKGLSVTRSRYYRQIPRADGPWRARGGQGRPDAVVPGLPASSRTLSPF